MMKRHQLILFLLIVNFAVSCQDQKGDSSSLPSSSLNLDTIRLWVDTTAVTKDSPEELKVWREFTSKLAPDYVHQDIRALLPDSTLNKVEHTIKFQKYFELDFALSDSTIVEAEVRHRRNDMTLELCDEIASFLIGHKPKYPFINKGSGGISMVLNKKKLVGDN